MAQTISDVAALHLEQVRKKLPELYEYEDTTLSLIEARKDVTKVSSREYRIPLQDKPGSRFGSVDLGGGALGRGTGTHYSVPKLTPLSSRIAIEINEDAIRQTDDETKAIRKLVLTEVKNAMREFRRQLNASLQTAGDGILATVTAVGNTGQGGDITVKAAPFYAQLLREGQIVSVYDSTVATKRGEFAIGTINTSTAVVTAVNDATGTVPDDTEAGDVLLPEKVSGANPVWYYGFPYHISNATTGTWLTMTRSSNPAIRANNVDAAGAALTTAPIRLLLRKIIQRVGKANLKGLKAHTHGTQVAAYEELAILISRIDKGSGNEAVDLLFGDVKFAGVPCQEDIHAARNRIDFWLPESWGRIESAPVDFLKKPDGSYFERPIDSTTGSQIAALLFWIIWFGQFFTDNPAAQGAITSLAVQTGYDTL
jgi:hypothetical protein